MADGLCDWQECDNTDVHPAIVRLHQDDHGRGPAHDEWRFELCPAHTALLVQWIEAKPLHEPPVDAGVLP
jgi:hypothetical protein